MGRKRGMQFIPYDYEAAYNKAIPEKEDITAEEQETLNEQMRNQMMLLYEIEKDEIEVQEEQSRIIEKMEETE